MRTTDLLTLAEAYCRATGEGFWRLSGLATGSQGTLYRIRCGHGCHSRTLERAWLWFDRNWPDGVEWPPEVPRPVAATRPGGSGGACAGGLAPGEPTGRDCAP